MYSVLRTEQGARTTRTAPPSLLPSSYRTLAPHWQAREASYSQVLRTEYTSTYASLHDGNRRFQPISSSTPSTRRYDGALR